ncbi:hypothetical protein CB663_22610 [Salmonella enterica subsp. enterica serovar Java]|uniref:Uncharacterized protein n=2 Tax=Salmonella enterica I TaxID=59201 RepID=A0A731MQH5_SALET|nr:hypothetical protein [Salmonella enterica]EBF7362027.1 hypothetical protein [Salmonella enterica subsp. enterica serovar Stanley]EBG3141099.1 hypothetical protein [Salmonella enterica subsp. enterica serovar Typhimurium]ECG7588662.1 hypothetical protein [Salmonella enterica subsp. enterica serovar Java]EDP8900623.1 hypothetical protein [Salmonella enterica subsp. enterica]EDZ8639651.1 hypothetical protein [Salmonella enterica subsp. enterica serovar Schwarzengrund]EEE1115542.1 hypothetical
MSPFSCGLFFNNKHRKKVFLHLTVHTVHLGYLSFYIMWLGGDELVKSEQSTLHLCDFCSSRMRPVRRCVG